MGNERWIKDIMVVFTKIERSTGNKKFKFPQGGSAIRMLDNFLQMLEDEYGCITEGRIVDVCICTAHAFRDRKDRMVKQMFGPASIKRMKESKRGARFYEDRWLSEHGLERATLIKMISDRSEHPQAKFIFMLSEEGTKTRFLNQEIGYALCQTATLGWSPISEACSNCIFTDSCKKATDTKYPELYRIRVEYGESSE